MASIILRAFLHRFLVSNSSSEKLFSFCQKFHAGIFVRKISRRYDGYTYLEHQVLYLNDLYIVRIGIFHEVFRMDTEITVHQYPFRIILFYGILKSVCQP